MNALVLSVSLLDRFVHGFTAPGFGHFTHFVLAHMALLGVPHCVTETLRLTSLHHRRHWTTPYAFLQRGRWACQHVSQCLLDVICQRLAISGEMVVVDKDGIHSHFPFKPQPHRFCVFEYIYFARPDSTLEGRNVYEARKNIGAVLAHEAPVEADMVIPVPDSGVPAALGFANAANIPFELGIIRNHYVGRTFIEPSDSIRHLGVRLKHNPNRAKLKGKKVVLVDDSIVRGTTSKKIVTMVRDAGATEVHFRVSSPPTTHSCFYGVDTPNTDDLLAHKMDVEQMRRFIGADSLAFISMNGLYRAMGKAERTSQAPAFCDACFTRRYPTPIPDYQVAEAVK